MSAQYASVHVGERYCFSNCFLQCLFPWQWGYRTIRRYSVSDEEWRNLFSANVMLPNLTWSKRCAAHQTVHDATLHGGDCVCVSFINWVGMLDADSSGKYRTIRLRWLVDYIQLQMLKRQMVNGAFIKRLKSTQTLSNVALFIHSLSHLYLLAVADVQHANC